MLNDLEEMLMVYQERDYGEESWRECVKEYIEELDKLSVPVPRTNFINREVG